MTGFVSDVDECVDDTANNCDQVCTNIVGGFECSCTGNTVLSANGITCNSKYYPSIHFPCVSCTSVYIMCFQFNNKDKVINLLPSFTCADVSSITVIDTTDEPDNGKIT